MSRYGFLLQQTVVREIRVRYKQTAIGALWAICQPLIFSILFFAIFKFYRGTLGSSRHFAILFFLTSMWTFFSNAVVMGTNSIVGHPGLITKIRFPREVFPLSFVAVGLVDLAISLGVSFILLMVSGYAPELRELAWVAFALLLLTLLSIFVSLALSGLNIYYRDFRYLVPVLVQIFFFGTPVIYALSDLDQRAGAILRWNPLTPIFDTVDRCLRHEPVCPELLLWDAVFILFLGEMACRVFRRLNLKMADVI